MQSVAQQYSTVVKISEQARALAISACLYDDCRKQEQRLLRELKRIQDDLAKCRSDKKFYGGLIGVE